MAKDHGKQIKDDELYEALREDGNSKEKAARIANQAASEGRRSVSKRGGRSKKYEDWSKNELYRRAQEVGIEGRSNMSKDELIQALRHH